MDDSGEMEEFPSNSMEEVNLMELGTILTWLLKEEVISDALYNFIESSHKLLDGIADVYKLLVSKNEQQKALKVLKMFRSQNFRFELEKWTNSESGGIPEERIDLIKRDPLMLNHDVVHYIFEYLPLSDVKNCSLVSRHWHSTLKTILRKRTKVVFDPLSERKPSTFLNIFQNSGDPPLSAFEFVSKCPITELQLFFDRWGRNIKQLSFEHVFILKNKKNPENHYGNYDISRWIASAPNLKYLKMHCCQGTELEVRLANLGGITSLLFSNSVIVLENQSSRKIKALSKNTEKRVGLPQKLPNTRSRSLKKASNDTRIAPRQISLYGVDFKQDGKTLEKVRLNNFIHFGEASEIKLFDIEGDRYVLEMDRQVFKAWGIHLSRNEAANWREAKGFIFLLKLNQQNFLTRNDLHIQQLFITCSAIDLSVLPQTIEKLHLAESVDIIRFGPVRLPNLAYLSYDVCDNELDCIGYFAQCPKLTEIEITDSGYGSLEDLNLEWFPKSLKKLKISGRINHVFGNRIVEIETLILENYLNTLKSCIFTDVTDLIAKIKPKVLVISWVDYSEDDDSEFGFDSQSTQSDEEKLCTTNIIEFLLENKHLEKVIVGSILDQDLHMNSPFETSIFSQFVDKKANHYQFENISARPFGKALTYDEFKILKTLDQLDKRFDSYSHHNAIGF